MDQMETYLFENFKPVKGVTLTEGLCNMTNRILRDQRRYFVQRKGRVCHELSLRQSDTPAMQCTALDSTASPDKETIIHSFLLFSRDLGMSVAFGRPNTIATSIWMEK